MRRTVRSIGVFFVAMLGAVGLVIGSAFAAALAFGATALIVPGTGTHNIHPPNAVIGYKENAADRYINVSGTAVHLDRRLQPRRRRLSRELLPVRSSFRAGAPACPATPGTSRWARASPTSDTALTTALAATRYRPDHHLRVLPRRSSGFAGDVQHRRRRTRIASRWSRSATSTTRWGCGRG